MRGTATRCDGASVSPASLASSTPPWKRNRGNPHFLRESERHQIDDELLVGANVCARILGLARPFAADANADGCGVAAKHIEERKRSRVDGAAGILGGDPGN